MRQRVVDRALGEVQNVLELHGKRRGASGLDNRLARRHNEVRQVEHRGAQSLVTLSVPGPFEEQDLVTLSVLGPFEEWAIR